MGYPDIEEEENLPKNLQNKDIGNKLTINPDIKSSRNVVVKNLERHLLATARFPGDEYGSPEDDESNPLEITPYITVRGVSWYEDVIIKGIYDEDFGTAVDALLEERGSLKLINQDMKDKIDRSLGQLREKESFRSCILNKMKECCTKPRGYLDYIQGNISWDSNKKCLSCPQQDCLIYIYNFYYNFLLETTPGMTITDKLYVLIVCEARICVLSKCLCLESIRIQDDRTDLVESLLDAVYDEDESKGRLLPEPSEKYTQMFEKVKRGQVGAGVTPDSSEIQGAIELGKETEKAEETTKEAESTMEQALKDTSTAEQVAIQSQEEADIASQSQVQAEQQRDVAIKNEGVETEREDAMKRELGETQQELTQEKDTEMAEEKTIESLTEKLKEYELKLSECAAQKSGIQTKMDESLTTIDQRDAELDKYGGTSIDNVLLADLTDRLSASFTEESKLSNARELILVKEPGFQSDGDNDKISQKFMELYFPIIRVALARFSAGENPEPYLRLYMDNHDLFGFIEPQKISEEVYGTDPSEGYIDELLFQILDDLPKTHDRRDMDKIVSMTPCIFLHSDLIDEYPLVKLPEGHYLLAPILQSMVPILKKNPPLFVRILLAMEKHERISDALKFGNMYLFKDVSDKYPEIKDIFERLVKMDFTKERDVGEGLSPGLDESHCKHKVDSIVDSLRRNIKTPISSKDMLYMNQCQEQHKVGNEYANISY